MSYILSHNDGAPARGIVGGLWEYARGGPRGGAGSEGGVGVDLLAGLDFRNTPNPPDRPMELIVGWPPGLLYARLSHWARWGGGEGLKVSLSAAWAEG